MKRLCSPRTAQVFRTWWYFGWILMHFDQNSWKICLGTHLGGPKSQKMLPRQGKASKIEDWGDPRLPKEAESCPQFDPSEAKGKQIRASTMILRAKSTENHWKIGQNWCQQAENLKAVKSAKSLKKHRFFNGFQCFLVFWSMENHQKHVFFW